MELSQISLRKLKGVAKDERLGRVVEDEDHIILELGLLQGEQVEVFLEVLLALRLRDSELFLFDVLEEFAADFLDLYLIVPKVVVVEVGSEEEHCFTINGEHQLELL